MEFLKIVYALFMIPISAVITCSLIGLFRLGLENFGSLMSMISQNEKRLVMILILLFTLIISAVWTKWVLK